jgi:hypothetical protein
MRPVLYISEIIEGLDTGAGKTNAVEGESVLVS